MKPNAGETIGFIFAIGCIIGGIVGLPWALGYAADAIASPGWPTVAGEILEHDVISSDRSATAAGRQGTSTSYLPTVRYRYTVAGETYESDQLRLDFGASYNSYSEAFDVVGPYMVDLPHDVYYDPADPANAVLEPGGDWRSYRPIGFSAAAVLLGVVTFGYTRWSMGKRVAREQERTAKKQARAAAKRAKTAN